RVPFANPDIVTPFSKKPLETRLEAPRGYASYCSAVAAANSASFRALLAAGSQWWWWWCSSAAASLSTELEFLTAIV
ncbi:hypothetical protein DKX15_23025, partial [Enterococcus faecium]